MGGIPDSEKNNEYHEYDLSKYKKFRGPIPVFWETYSIECIISDLMDWYIKDEPENVRKLFEKNKIKENLAKRGYLIDQIVTLNGISDKKEIRRSRAEIKIPSNYNFFHEVFPEYKITQKDEYKLDPRIGRLDKLDFDITLELIVAGETPGNNLSGAAGMEINKALHNFKIHSADQTMATTLDKASMEGIKIFRKEYMEPNDKEYEEAYFICKETLLAMNKALTDGWTRSLYFYYLDESGNEFYINDEDIKLNVSDDTEVWAREGNNSKKIGRRRSYSIKDNTGTITQTYYGIQHMGEIKYTSNSNSVERICIPIVKSEGDGYDAINAYDNVALSVGMFNRNREWLFNLLKKL
jgi:hypothetical protein